MVVKKLAAEKVPVVAMARDPGSEAAAELRGMDYVEVVKADLRDRESLTEAVRGCRAVICTAAVKPMRFGKVSDLWSDPFSDPGHPANLNLRGIQNLISACEETSPPVQKLVRVTGLSVGLSPWSPISILFSLVNSFANRWNREGELAIRASSMDYTVIRPAGIKDCPKASETGDKLLLATDAPEWEGQRPPATTGISREDVADLVCASVDDKRLSKATLRVSRMARGTARNFYRDDARGGYTWDAIIPRVLPDRPGSLAPADYDTPAAAGLVLLSFVLGCVYRLLSSLLSLLARRVLALL
uniref:NAD(P)-binding domain-containing protein n=1 Tax=Hemiselmis andersenii TaxID=464988 RepID=A0A7S1HA13_HEMAN